MALIDNLPLVSVVTPSYNQAAYLEDTLRSVLAQKYPNLEYLVVDGGSNDGSVEIVERYSHQLTWWISEPDQGQAEAINKGLKRAKGEIVSWLNSDDVYLPGALAGAVAAFDAHPEAGLVYGDAVTIDARGCPLNPLTFADWGLEELMRFRIICQPAVFMRRQVLEEIGLLDASYHYFLDHQLWLRIASVSPIQHIPSRWAAARHHPGAKNVAQAEAFGAEVYWIVDWMKTTPVFADQFERDRRRIMGGAHRLNARYLLDGGLPGQALRVYWQAMLAWPGFALKHWHRMVYALLSVFGGAGLGDWYYRLTARKRLFLGDDSRLVNWPGINLEGKV
jgi:GT2 family glycosyltransferase